MKEEVKQDPKREFIMLLNNSEIKSFMQRYSEQIGEIFNLYLFQMGEEMPADASINMTIFTKFCTEFDIISILSQEQINSIFGFLTKKKKQAVINDEEFVKALILIANKGKESLQVEGDGVQSVERLFEMCEISLPIKSLKKKIKKLKENIEKNKKKTKKGMSLERVLGKKTRKITKNNSFEKIPSNKLDLNKKNSVNKSDNFTKINNESNESFNSEENYY